MPVRWRGFVAGLIIVSVSWLAVARDTRAAEPGTVQLVERGVWADPHEPSNVKVLWVADGYACLADQPWGLHIVDTRDTSNPVQAGFVSMPGVQDVYTVSQQVYAAASLNGRGTLKVYDISDPSDPAFVTQYYQSSSGLTRVFGGNGYVYTAGGSTVYAVYNGGLSGVFTSSRTILDACISGERAYLTTMQGSDYFLTAFDISNPLAWNAAGSVSLSTNGYGVSARDGLVFVANGFNGLQIRAAGDLRSVGGTDTGGMASDVWADDRYAYVADGDNGIVVFDISDPARPRQVVTYYTPGTAQGLFVDGRCIYVADGSGGLRILLLNHFPGTPAAVSPAGGATVDSLTPLLRASFSDPDGDGPASTQWQVGADPSCAEPVYGSDWLNGVIQYSVPAEAGLGYGTTYWWRVRCADPYGAESEWSDPVSFTTPDAPPPPPPPDDSPGDDSPGDDSPGDDPPDDDPGDDPPPPPPRHHHRDHTVPRQATVLPPPPIQLWRQGMLTVSIDPCRIRPFYPLELPLPYLSSDERTNALELLIPGGVTISGWRPAAGTGQAGVE